jgi:hypothetical protein
MNLPSGLFPSGFLTENLCAYVISPIHATCPSHIILDFITLVTDCVIIFCNYTYPSIYKLLIYEFLL